MIPKKPKRWPWIVAIIVAFVFGDMVGHSGHTTTTADTAAATSNNTTTMDVISGSGPWAITVQEMK